ncbi:MAG: 4-(cytidine 5'-diphospho)-2-C-methyl-D-erythritol kinase [Clostridia bacterium]|nr:4-(cytidine 5'-diphospho)-2-C-methyl-D-erythritol kinase [Clostridia bacterium]
MTARVKAYAKLNLTLSLTGVMDGYHTLDSLVCTVDLFDYIKLKKRKDNLINVEMRGQGLESLPPEKNNAVKAGEEYVKTFATRGADIVIYKNIPVGAGLGGSSADVAGVLRGMTKLYGAGSERQLKEIADRLGSDTGYLLTGGFARLTGRGEQVESLKLKQRLDFLLLLPKEGVSTAECYRLSDSFPQENTSSDGAIKALSEGDTVALGKSLNNALYLPATKLNGDVKTAYEELSDFSPLGVNMTGSGSGVFALFENAEFCAWAKSRYRGKFKCIQLKTHIPKI